MVDHSTEKIPEHHARTSNASPIAKIPLPLSAAMGMWRLGKRRPSGTPTIRRRLVDRPVAQDRGIHFAPRLKIAATMYRKNSAITIEARPA